MATYHSSPNPLEINGLETWYPTGKEPALIDANIQLRSGEVAAIVGPSGVGKSTLLNAILNEIPVVSGNIKIAGEVVLNGRAINPHLYSFVPQETNLVETLTVWETIELAAYARLGADMDEKDRWQRVTEVLNQLDLHEKRNDPTGKLSGGQKRRVSIAMELVSEPQLLILDEPTTGLDEHLIREVHDLFRAIADGPRKPAILFVTHSVTQLDQVDKIIAMGKAAASHPDTATVRYFGRPDYILDAFGATDFPDLLNKLSEPAADSTINPSGRKPKSFNRPYKTLSWKRSVLYNLKRQWLLLGGFKGLTMMFLATLGIGAVIALTLLLISNLGLGLNVGGINQDFLTYTSILVILLALVGTILPVMGIVGFWQTGRREQKWGVSARAMVWAQLCIHLMVIVPTVAAATVFSLWLTELPTTETILPQLGDYSAHWQLFSLLLLSTLTSYCIGVLIGCMNTSTNTAVIAAGVVIAIMLVGNGLIFSWSEKPPLYYLSYLVPSRTGMALVASNFNAEQAMGMTDDRAFRMEENEFYTVILATVALAILIMLIAMYTARYPLFQAGSGKKELTRDTSQPMPSNPISSGLKNPRFAAAVLSMLLITTGGVYAKQFLDNNSISADGDVSQNLGLPAPTQPVPNVGSQPQQQAQPTEPAQQESTTQDSRTVESANDQSGDSVNIDVSVNVDAQLAAQDAESGDVQTTDNDAATAEPDAFAAVPESNSDEELTDMEGQADQESTALAEPGAGIYFDLGGDDEPESLRGLSEPMDVAGEGQSWSCELGGFNDTTKRDQIKPAADGSWVVVPLQANPGESATVSFCIEESQAGTDTWELWLGGDRPNAHGCDQRLMDKPDDMSPGLNVVSLEIPAECIPSGQVMLVFTSQQQDGAGIFGFLVEQQSLTVAETDDTPPENSGVETFSSEEESSEGDVEIPEENESAAADATEEAQTVSDEESADQAAEESDTEPAIEPIDAVVEEVAEDESMSDEAGTEEESEAITAIEGDPNEEATLEVAIDESNEGAATEEESNAIASIEEAPGEEATLEVAIEEPTEEPTEEVIVEELPVEPMPANATYFDLGGHDDADARGFGGVNDLTDRGDPWSCKLGGFRDYTARDQIKPSNPEDAVVVPLTVNPLMQTTVTFCIEENESLSSNWELRLGGDRPENHGCNDMYLSKPGHFSAGLNTVTWVIPPECIPSDELKLEFTHQNGDGAGIWGFLVEYDPNITALPEPEETPEFEDSTPAASRELRPANFGIRSTYSRATPESLAFIA